MTPSGLLVAPAHTLYAGALRSPARPAQKLEIVMAFSLAIALVLAYFLGAIPSGYLAGRLISGIDIRAHGSRSTGATNVLRTVGPWAALAVLVADVAKGVAAIIIARFFVPWIAAELPHTPPTAAELQAWLPWATCLAGLAVLLGHGRSIWLNFTGGKSAATGLGVLLALSWPVGLGAAAIFAIVLALTRIVSLSSMLAALAAIVLVLALEHTLPSRLLVIGGAAYVIVRHRANVRRLLDGTEPRIGRSTADAKPT